MVAALAGLVWGRGRKPEAVRPTEGPEKEESVGPGVSGLEKTGLHFWFNREHSALKYQVLGSGWENALLGPSRFLSETSADAPKPVQGFNTSTHLVDTYLYHVS